jgi:hypothetical protein
MDSQKRDMGRDGVYPHRINTISARTAVSSRRD